jgi:hypothetical protein
LIILILPAWGICKGVMVLFDDALTVGVVIFIAVTGWFAITNGVFRLIFHRPPRFPKLYPK